MFAFIVTRLSAIGQTRVHYTLDGEAREERLSRKAAFGRAAALAKRGIVATVDGNPVAVGNRARWLVVTYKDGRTMSRRL